MVAGFASGCRMSRLPRARLIACFAALCAAAGCGGGAGAATPADAADTATLADGAGDPGVTDVAPADSAEIPYEIAMDAAPDEVAPATYDGPWRKSLKSCWTDATCTRALLVSHGGDWDADLPYGSKAAFVRAYEKGADAIKTDFLVTKDDVGVVAHSSPILFYESPECVDRKIEEMTADEVTACHIGASQTETYQRVDDVMEWARGKVLLMLTVKSDTDFGRAISTAIEHDATEFVFIEAYLGAFQGVVLPLPDHDRMLYNIEVGGTADVGTLLDTIKNPVAFSCEMDASYPDADTAAMSALIANRLHPAGVKAFIDAKDYTSVAAQAGLFQEGFDIVMTYSLDNAVTARIQVDQARGVTPP